MDNSDNSENDKEADYESNIELGNGVEDLETSEQWNVGAALNVPWFIQPTWRSKKQGIKMLIVVNTIETRRNKGIKKRFDRMCEWIFTWCFI